MSKLKMNLGICPQGFCNGGFGCQHQVIKGRSNKNKMMRDFCNIKQNELDKAIINMLDELDIGGSYACGIGGYDLYKAIYNEWNKSKDISEEDLVSQLETGETR